MTAKGKLLSLEARTILSRTKKHGYGYPRESHLFLSKKEHCDTAGIWYGHRGIREPNTSPITTLTMQGRQQTSAKSTASWSVPLPPTTAQPPVLTATTVCTGCCCSSPVGKQARAMEQGTSPSTLISSLPLSLPPPFFLAVPVIDATVLLLLLYCC